MRNIIHTSVLLLMLLASNQIFAQTPTEDEPGDPGLTEMKSHQDYQVYPNPTNGKFRVAINNNNDKTVIRITNLSGLIMWQEMIDEKQSSRIIDLDFAFTPGSYAVMFIRNNKIAFSRLVLVR